MSVDLIFNKSISFEDIKIKTGLKIKEGEHGSKFLVDEYGNSFIFLAFSEEEVSGLTIREYENPTKILDELVGKFELMYMDDERYEHFRGDKEGECSLNNLCIDYM